MSKKKQEQNARKRNKKLQEPQEAPEADFSALDLMKSPRLDQFHAPDGFRAVPFLQAVMGFAEPLQDFLESDSEEEMEQMMDVAMNVWNFSLSNVPLAEKMTREELVEQISDTFEMDETDAEDALDGMLERKAYLLPEDIQPEDGRVMFIRYVKGDERYQIIPVDEAQIPFSAAPIPAAPEDSDMLHLLRELDGKLADGEAYAQWEDLYFQAEEVCCNRFFDWLKAKGVTEKETHAFPYCVEVFFDFIYRYTAGTLARAQSVEFEDFLRDHLVRTLMIQPDDYALWPPAIRFFYRFLAEKGYLADAQPVINLVTSLEPEFIAYLKQQFA